MLLILNACSVCGGLWLKGSPSWLSDPNLSSPFCGWSWRALCRIWKGGSLNLHEPQNVEFCLGEQNEQAPSDFKV